MLTTLPLECFVCREVMFGFWFPNEPFDQAKHLIFTTSLVVTAMTLSLFTCDLGGVFELIGATSACALAYILPPLCYIKLSTRSWRTWVSWVCVVFGFVVMGITVFSAIMKMITGEGGWKSCA
jgi:solute carrier family 38 (sodium-coupled neutral amino acid transporter), member 11